MEARVSEAEDLLARYLQAQEDKDLDALVSCWHPDVEVCTRCGRIATGAVWIPTAGNGS